MDKRYTLSYRFRGRSHTIQFPADTDKDAKKLAQKLFDANYDALMSFTKGGEEPVFEHLLNPKGQKMRWKPT